MKRSELRSYAVLSVLCRVLIQALKLRERGSLSNIDEYNVAKDCCKHYLYASLQRIQLLNSDTR